MPEKDSHLSDQTRSQAHPSRGFSLWTDTHTVPHFSGPRRIELVITDRVRTSIMLCAARPYSQSRSCRRVKSTFAVRSRMRNAAITCSRRICARKRLCEAYRWVWFVTCRPGPTSVLWLGRGGLWFSHDVRCADRRKCIFYAWWLTSTANLRKSSPCI